MTRALLFRAGARWCALAATDVDEILRPGAVSPIAGAPDFVSGVMLLRGVATPVVDLGLVLAGTPLAAPTRLVSVRLPGGRRVALAVDEVRGLVALDAPEALPGLIAESGAGAIQRIGRIRELDSELLVVLAAGHLVPADLLDDAERSGIAPPRPSGGPAA